MKIVKPRETLEQLRTLYRQGFKPGCETGWPTLTKQWTVAAAQLTVVTGIPSHGKSSWMDSLMVNLTRTPLDKRPWKFLVCSPEQEPLAQHEAELIERIVGKRFRQGEGRMKWEEAEEVATTTLQDRFTFLELEQNDTFGDLLGEVRSLAASDPTTQWGILLDPWNRLEHRRPSGMNETDYVSEALSAATRVKNETKAHIFIVAHPTKMQRDRNSGERPVPTPYDISGAAHWYNKTDNCICVWRDPTADDAIAKRTRIYVQKVRWRHVGKAGDFAELEYDVATGRYSDPLAMMDPKKPGPRMPYADPPEDPEMVDLDL
jgi:twinkle protein